jgi:hypothetical protein
MRRQRLCTAACALVAGLVAVLGLAGPALAESPPTGPYAPLDQPGPPLTVPPAQLAASLSCTPNVDHAVRAPVLLVPGTTLTPDINFSWNYERAFTQSGIAWCAVTLPKNAMGDIQTAGEYLVSAIRTMHARAGRTIDIVGFSQGGMVPRWALRFWPDTRTMVNDFVALDPSNHGTLDAYPACLLTCAPALWQQQTGSRFLDALNSGAETFAGISYTVVYSRTDEVVVPNFGPRPSSSLRTGDGDIRNIAVQDICPLDLSEHLAMGTYDPVGYALVNDAFNNRGPADPARINRGVCGTAALPGVRGATFLTDFGTVVTTAGQQLLTAKHVKSEPALQPYVFRSPTR